VDGCAQRGIAAPQAWTFSLVGLIPIRNYGAENQHPGREGIWSSVRPTFSREGAADVSAFRHVPVSLLVEGASTACLEQLYREHYANVVREFQRLTTAEAEDLA
jgi:hypothetical protein